MAFFHDLSHSEGAQQLALPVGTVKTWIRRSLEKLKICLARGDAQ
jgi:RNA polymerase sigma-70 factor (ECF subfamily)